MQGAGYEIINDLIIGVVGSFTGGWLLPQLGIHLGVGIVAAIINSTVGALFLLLVLNSFTAEAAGAADGVGLAPLALSSPFANGTSRRRGHWVSVRAARYRPAGRARPASLCMVGGRVVLSVPLFGHTDPHHAEGETIALPSAASCSIWS